MRNHKNLQKTLLSIALGTLLAGCGNKPADAVAETNASSPSTAVGSTEKPMDEDALVAELANTLQGCSYDGSPVKADTSALSDKVPTDCRDMVAQIMKFTGLPQNFDVVEGNVPNAAAMIVMGEDKLPHRVIAFNAGFMDDVRRATNNNNWAPVSIMAHEIGHHLSGHTITPGGSQPPIELEADKFSGFVLYKMGAQLSDAQKALITLVPEADGATHPGRAKRVAAIQDGWKQACQQQGGTCDTVTTSTSSTPSAPVPTATAPVNTTASKPLPNTDNTITANAAVASGARDVLPAPSTSATPSKFNQFIYDELGLLDAGTRAKFERQMYEYAQQHGVEIVTIMAKDLRGLSGDEYAYAMMRQLRVGKLDVGNGAVFVVAPEQGAVGVAMGPGVMLEMKVHIEGKKKLLSNFIEFGYKPVCKKKAACGPNWTEVFMGAADHTRRNTDNWEWTIRHQSFANILAADKAYSVERKATGANYDPAKSPSFRTIARLHGKVIKLNAPAGDKTAWVNDSKVKDGYRAVHVRSGDGRNFIFYVDPNTEALMPAGKLVEGRNYAFIARISNISPNPKDSSSFNLLSYDLTN